MIRVNRPIFKILNPIVMAEEKLGIENLKRLIKFPLDLVKQAAESSQDGWQATDIFSFVDEFNNLPGIVRNWNMAVDELRDLSAEERTQLHEYFKEQFDIPNDQLESFIENALLNAVSLIALYDQFKALPKKS